MELWFVIKCFWKEMDIFPHGFARLDRNTSLDHFCRSQKMKSSILKGQDGALFWSQPSSTVLEKPSWQCSSKCKFQYSIFGPLLFPSSISSFRACERQVHSSQLPSRFTTLSTPLKAYNVGDECNQWMHATKAYLAIAAATMTRMS